METIQYKDPTDLRDIPLDRLRIEGQQKGLQFNQWNDLFNIQSAIRVNNTHLVGSSQLSELEMYCILSNRYLLMEREHLTEFKLFTKDEVLRMISEAFIAGFQQGYGAKTPYEWPEFESEYMKQKSTI